MAVDFATLFQDVLTQFDTQPDDFSPQRVQDELVGQMAELLEADYDTLALEINDSVVQGLTAALYALEIEDTAAVSGYVRRTLDAAQRLITDLVSPLEGEEFRPGALVRSNASSLGEPTAVPLPD